MNVFPAAGTDLGGLGVVESFFGQSPFQCPVSTHLKYVGLDHVAAAKIWAREESRYESVPMP